MMRFLSALWIAAILASDSVWALNKHIVHLEQLGGGSVFGRSDRTNSFTMVATARIRSIVTDAS